MPLKALFLVLNNNICVVCICFRAFQHICDLETPECQVYNYPGQGEQPMLGAGLHVVSNGTLF